jgi:hypothetical protein
VGGDARAAPADARGLTGWAAQRGGRRARPVGGWVCFGAGVALTRGGWTGRSAPARRAPGAAGAATIVAGGLAHVKASPPSWPPPPSEARLPAPRAGGGVLPCGYAVNAPRARGGLEARARAVWARREARAGCRTTTKIRDQERPSCDRQAIAECTCLHHTRLPLDGHGSFGELEGGAGKSARPETARRWSEVARITRGRADARAGCRGRCPPPPERIAAASVECAARAAAHARKGGRGAPRRRGACRCWRGTAHVWRDCARRWTRQVRGHVSRYGVLIP